MRLPPTSIHILRTAIINSITGAVAVGLAANRRRNPEIAVRSWPREMRPPRAQIIIPARDEERNIGPLLSTLLAQSYPADAWGITVVDDGSSDDTYRLASEVAASAPHVKVVQAPPLPPGWTGKSHAMWTGAMHASDAEWLLFVDADTRHHRDMLSSVLVRAIESRADLLSLVIDVDMRSFWERVIVPQVGELYTLLVGSMDQVNRGGEVASANGQFILIRADLYRATGRLPQVRGDVAEDRALAQACKRRRANVRMEYGRRLVRARVYSSLPEMWRGYSKTLFWASGHNTARAVAVALALAFYALLPPLALAFHLLRPHYAHKGAALLHAAMQMGPMLALRVAVCRQMGIPLRYAVTYPLAVAMGDAMLLYSLCRVRSGRGVQWKGRTYT